MTKYSFSPSHTENEFCHCPACCRERYPEHLADIERSFDCWYEATETEWDAIVAGTLDDDDKVEAAMRHLLADLHK